MASSHTDSEDSSESDDFLGEPDMLPRIGDEYQVKIPSGIGESNHFSHLLVPEESESSAHYLPGFVIGFPIPLTMISLKPGISCQDAVKSETNSDNEKFEISNDVLNDLGKPEKELQDDHGNLLVPGSSNVHWTDDEKASLLLGLYIFERNFVEVRRFVGTKKMGAILSFYYGEFYGSDEYRTWSGGRKTKSKKCVYGQKIFSGMREQELLSRVLPTLSEDQRDALLEVSKRYGDGKISLSEYVSSLKALVGMDTFVKAVGIGKGKEDLTKMNLDSSRSNQVNSLRRETPIGKACSTLTTPEIIKFLSGGYRLSKARSFDLFWEAIWPRLLARGWHSEQPKDQGFVVDFNHSLVFLVPGVVKFSRRKLVKGDHYFDSIPDILSKVAKDPQLIELDNIEVERENNKEECISISGRELENDGDGSPSRQRHCYLQPRTPNRHADIMEITVVDTSCVGGKVRELRSLPTKILNASSSQVDSYGSRYKSLNRKKSKLSAGNLKRKKSLHEKKQPKKVSRTHLSTKLKRVEVRSEGGAAPVSKRCRRLTASIQENGMPNNGSSIIRESIANISSGTCSYPDKLSSSSSSKGSPSEYVECASNVSLDASESSPGIDIQTLIHLNKPQVSLETEKGVFAPELAKEQDIRTSEATEARSEQESFAEPRRHSTRYRPPTTKALEAVANGYLSVKKRRKSKDKVLMSRPSKRARAAGPTESTSSSMPSHVEEAENGVSNSGNCNVFDDSQVLPDADEEILLEK